MSGPVDRFGLYERAVQNPAHEVDFFAKLFHSRRGRALQTLREDFAGTAAVSVAWVRSGPDRQAWAVEHDAAALAWCRRHHLSDLSAAEKARITLVEDDVRTLATPCVDLICAENFSYSVFHDRRTLRTWLEATRAGLVDDGLLIIDAQGGPACLREGRRERRRVGDLVVEWEQRRFDPITHRVEFALHLEHPELEGGRLEDAFVYDWRLWGLPELRELLLEAGFGRAEVYWAADGRREGTFRRQSAAPALERWVAYVVAER